MNDRIQNSTARVSARRRLIRGAFAAPAALTLYSGNVFAVASNQQCIINQVANPATPPPGATTGPGIDTWVRVQLWTLDNAAHSDNQGSKWVYGGDLAALIPAGSYLGSTDWQCFSISGNGSHYHPGDIVVGQEPTGIQLTLRHDGAWVAVRIDATGKIIGVVGVGTDGSAVAQSCWTSFA